MTSKRETLKEIVVRNRDWAAKKGRRIERYIDVCWWGSLVFAGLASVAGFIAEAPQIKEHLFAVDPWMISALAAIATGFQLVRQRAGWRAKASAYHTYRAALVRLNISLLLITSDDDDEAVKTLTEEFLAADQTLGETLRRINELRDDPGSEASSPQPSGRASGGS